MRAPKRLPSRCILVAHPCDAERASSAQCSVVATAQFPASFVCFFDGLGRGLPDGLDCGLGLGLLLGLFIAIS